MVYTATRSSEISLPFVPYYQGPGKEGGQWQTHYTDLCECYQAFIIIS